MEKGKLKRRVVHLINNYPEPHQIFDMILEKEWQYSVSVQKEFACRDRALMALGFGSAGRITEIVGGPQWKWDKTLRRGIKTGKKHSGLQVDNLRISAKYLLISGMRVVKRSQKVIDKYGDSVTHRDDFVIPLQMGLFTNKFWDQLVPFGWLIVEYLKKFAPKKGKLFPFEDTRAFQIVREVTGMFPHWFRAQAEHFYGHYLLSDTVKLAKFVNIQDPKHVKHYIGYSWAEQLKDTEISMNFEWIANAVSCIRERMG